ncbi:tetratricopeptide repeat protein 19, mitochondrial isoform X8 [Cynocephalus volans]|uniref:tetratricopeptide repeat protein 19, mitochondrial isoform X8 n=1 Tax=Cynocephalus volans TaxID=110931 RepID=UPI002FC8CA73
MYRFLRLMLSRGLLRAAGRRCRGCSARLLPGPAGGAGPEVRVPPRRSAPHGRGRGLLPLLAALAWFSRPAAAAAAEEEEEEEEEEQQQEAAAAEDAAEAEIIRLLKRAKEDNAIIEISLKLASIYAAQNRQEFALAGYEFCISTLEEKIEREKELTEDIMSVEEKASTHLLLGMCLDACARYLLFSKQPSQAQRMYEKALKISEEIQGERHPQTIVLMSDLATTLDAQGHFDEAYIYMKRASDLARQINHPELHMVLSNLAAILMHRGFFNLALVKDKLYTLPLLFLKEKQFPPSSDYNLQGLMSADAFSGNMVVLFTLV